jgi:hypothetical protein
MSNAMWTKAAAAAVQCGLVGTEKACRERGCTWHPNMKTRTLHRFNPKAAAEGRCRATPAAGGGGAAVTLAAETMPAALAARKAELQARQASLDAQLAQVVAENQRSQAILHDMGAALAAHRDRTRTAVERRPTRRRQKQIA